MKTILLLCIGALLLPAAATAQICVIAHKSVAVSSVTKEDVANLYNLDSRELGGNKIKLFTIQSDAAVRDQFFELLGKTSVAIRKVWMQKQLTGNGTAPENTPDEAAMAVKIATTPGAVGYVSQSKVPGDVKVLLVLQ